MSQTPAVVEDAQVVNGFRGEELDRSSEDPKAAQKKAAKHDSGAADLEKVTDYAEETEISSKDIAGAMTLIGDKRSRENAEKEARKKEMDKVVISKADVDLIMNELEVSKSQAELSLRQNNGDVVRALIELTN